MMTVLLCPVCDAQVLSHMDRHLPFEGNGASYYPPDSSAFGLDRPSRLTPKSVSRVTAGAEFYRLCVAAYGGALSTLLDIGSGNGAVVIAAAQDGCESLGIDVDVDAVRSASLKGGPFIHGDFREVELPVRSFDVISMFDVIEHFCDPVHALRAASRLAAPGGILVVTTPDTDGWLRARQGPDYYHYTKDHRVLFGRRTLKALVDRAQVELLLHDDLGRHLLHIGLPPDSFAVRKYNEFRSHQLIVVRVE